MILLDDAALSYISEKNYGPRERSQIVEIIRSDSSPVLLLALARDLGSRRPLPRIVLTGKLYARSCEIPLMRDTAALHALISQRWETREISELSTSLIKIARAFTVNFLLL